MKSRIPFFTLAFAAILFAFYPSIQTEKVVSKTSSQPLDKADITGVWKYEWEGWDGMAILSPTHFIWVLSAKSRQPFTTPNPSVPEKAKAYDALLAGAGTWELVSEKRVKTNFLLNASPEAKNTPPVWDFELSGTTLIARVLQPDGKPGDPIRSRKLADWNAPSEVAMLNGVWEYIGLSGLYLQAGNYGAWIIVNGTQTNPSTDEAKAKNFDVLNCSAVVGTRILGNRHAWNVLHAKDPRNEKAVFYSDCTMSNPDLCKMWFVDTDGKALGDGWQVKRIAK